jgi:hypothetical protein
MQRRLFVQGASALSVGKVLPASTELAIHERPATGTAPAVRGADTFNGGRSQVNMNFLQTGGDYPFLNCLKTAQSWSLLDNTNWPVPSTLDADGYPTSISNGGVYTVFFVPSQSARPGNYVVTWNGNGTIFLGMDHARVSGSKSSSSGKGRFVFSTSSSRFVVGIQQIGSPHITNMKVFHVKDEAALEDGQVFGAKLKQRLLEANFGVIRFLNWQDANTTTVTTWASRKPESYVFYSAPEFRASLYAGVTSNKGPHYQASLPDFKLVDKAMVIVKFNASCSGPCTLDISGTGPVNVLSEYSDPLSSGGNSYVEGGTWRSLATLVYDDVLKSWIKFGGDLAFGSTGIRNGCPPQLMVRLCAEIGAHPHFVAPIMAVDPLTDYIPNLAALCRSEGPAWMVPRFEGPNELWNRAAGFLGSGHAIAKAEAYGWGPDLHNWYGKVMSVMGQAVSAAYEGDSRAYQVLCGVQTATGATMAGTLTSNARLSSAKYVSQSRPAQAPYTKSPASRWVTHVCCAQYYTPSDYGLPREQEQAAQYATAAGDPARQGSIANAYASTSERGTGPFTLRRVAEMYVNWKAWALSFGVRSMCGYEGGYSPDLGGSEQVRALRAASKRAECLEAFTTANYRNFVSLTMAGFKAEFPSCFQLSGATPTDNAWSVLDDVYETPGPPQWRAIVAFNRRA